MVPAYNAPDIGPREFLIAVRDDLTVVPALRYDAARKLEQFDRVVRDSDRDIPRQSFAPVWKAPRQLPKRPLDYQPPPRSKSPRSRPRPKSREPTTRYEWQILLKHREYVRETRTPVTAEMRRQRDRVVIRKPDPDAPA
jgi:hypothetical protein